MTLCSGGTVQAASNSKLEAAYMDHSAGALANWAGEKKVPNND